MPLKLRLSSAALLVALFAGSSPCDAAPPAYRIAQVLDIDTVPSWFPVGFCLLTHGDQQYVAYYNQEHEMTVARRRVGTADWQKVKLPSKIGWDSHNYITMTMDAAGQLHLAGNMHCVPLIYFRTRVPGDITTLERLPMTGQDEQRCTYPRFLSGGDGQLLFMYRSGSSGNGRRFFNAYDPSSGRWSRFLQTPLFDGQDERNAYPQGPKRGPDGRFHVVWVWRDTPDCATNHHLSYARSPNLQDWENVAGQSVSLPLVLERQAVWVDPIPSGGGIINGCESLAFDADQRPVIAYHKLDERGHMQIYVARFSQGAWRPQAITAWDKNITFGGGGAMPFIGIAISNLVRPAPGYFSLTWRHRDYGSGRIVLDEATLQPVDRELPTQAEYPRELSQPSLEFDGIYVKLAEDSGDAPPAGVKYVLRWETLEANHDRPRQPPLPPASRLQLVELVAGS